MGNIYFALRDSSLRFLGFPHRSPCRLSLPNTSSVTCVFFVYSSVLGKTWNIIFIYLSPILINDLLSPFVSSALACICWPPLPLPLPIPSTAALLRELVKEMPAEKRLSFQTRVANARTKEEVESVLQDFAPRLECLALPHARSRDVDLQQVKKVKKTKSAM